MSLTAEMAFIGAVLIEPKAVLKECPFIRPSHFSLPVHKQIFEAAQRCLNKNDGRLDLVLLAEEIGEMNTEMEAVGGDQYLVQLIDSCPSSQSAPHYARIVFEHALRRHLAVISQQLVYEAKKDLGGAMRKCAGELNRAIEAHRKAVP